MPKQFPSRWRFGVCLVATLLLSAGCESVAPTSPNADQDMVGDWRGMRAAIELACNSGLVPNAPIEIWTADQIALPEQPTRLVLIIDTSGSMRRAESDAFKPAVEAALAQLTLLSPKLERLWVLDAQGRELFGAKGRPANVVEKSAQTLSGLLQPTVAFSGSDPTVGLVKGLKILASEEGSGRAPWDIVVLSDELGMRDASLFAAVMKMPLGNSASQAEEAEFGIRLHVVQFPLLFNGKEPSTAAALGLYAEALTAKFGGQYFRIFE